MPDTETFAMTAEQDAAFAAMQAAETENVTDEAEEGQEGAEAGPEEPVEGADAAAAPKGPKTVPHGALHAEREEHKKTRSALEQERQKHAADMARVEERLRIIQQMQAPPQDQQKPAEMPDPQTDPIGALNFLLAERKAGQEQAQQHAVQTRQQQERQAFVNDYVTAVADYKSKNPDLQDAYNFALAARKTELEYMGMNPQQVREALENEELALAVNGIQRGIHPGDMIMGYAKMRGWQPKAQPGGAAAEVERLAAGVKGGKSLSQAGGGATPGQMTAEQLLKMSDEDFDAWTRKNPAQAKRLMGA